MKTDVLIIGCGCSGLYCAMNLPGDWQITIITKQDAESNDSFLAQGGICMLKDESDYDSYFEDTLKAGHYENDRKSVEIMIRSSQSVINDLVNCGVRFQRNDDGSFAFTREGAHSDKRILFHEDITGKEITSHLLAKVRSLPNVKIIEYNTMVDIITKDNSCYGAVIKDSEDNFYTIEANYTVLATGGIGGLFRHSTNFRHLTGDGIAACLKHGVKLENINYIQIHPTTFYSEDQENRSFLISESVRGEGAKLYGKDMHRFTNELKPRDLLSQDIRAQMKKDGTKFVWEDLRPIPPDVLKNHFPNIVEHCREAGYDVFKECIPVVPAQHYFMGGIWVNHESHTSMLQLYAIGETACNGVHGKNRLASNSLLESLVFAKRAAFDMTERTELLTHEHEMVESWDLDQYRDYRAFQDRCHNMVMDEIDRENGNQKPLASYRTF
ncbi:MAG: L-aspartate oxidase [Lachnospiraceae bacterium]|jgi:L-aspartate oxidase|nr:L-aspartate oxidase [Lachnospiraceae bacterium]MEE3460348.1 L-aspartate oxidase [Lachnospiraceae bacterium]